MSLAAAVALAGCGIDRSTVDDARSPTTTTTTEPDVPRPPTAEQIDKPDSSPFTAAEVPDDLTLVTAGVGEHEQAWGSEDLGNDSPVTVLATDGDPGEGGLVFVLGAGFDGLDDGLEGLAGPNAEEVEAGGFPAWFRPAAPDEGGWAALTVPAGPDLAVQVTAPDAEVDDLARVFESVTAPGDRRDAPVVDDPPGDLEVVGSLDADGVLAVEALLPIDDSGAVPGPIAAHSAVWADCAEGETDVRECDGSLVITTVPDGSVSPLAAAAHRSGAGRSTGGLREGVWVTGVFVGDATGVVTSEAVDGVVVRRTLVVPTEWGDDLVIVHRAGLALGPQVLAGIAEGVTQASDGEWADLVEEATG